jgi:hypothetical protein
MDLNWQSILSAVIKIIGFFLTGITAGVVIFLVHRALSRLLGRLIPDEIIAQAGATLAVILLGLKGLSAVLRYITQNELRYLHNGLTGLLDDMAGVIQWVVLIVVLLFIGYTLRGWRGGPSE